MNLCVPPPPLPTPAAAAHEPTYLALNTDFRWRQKRVAVRFLDGEPELRARVAAVVCGPEGWNSACGLQFAFVEAGEAEVRVTFARGGSWSYVGTYCRYVPQDLPTMQLGWLSLDTNPVEVRRVVLHEFGHALGFEHEHRSPAARIPWDMEQVYDYYWRTNGWSREKVDGQVITPIDPSVLEYTEWDHESIMHYRIPSEIVIGGVELGGATRLSLIDRAMAGVWYGLPPVQWRQTWLPVITKFGPPPLEW